VQIYTPLHPFDAEQRRREEYGKPGSPSVLRAVIGGGSVVTREVPEAVFAAGNPCRVIRAIGE